MRLAGHDVTTLVRTLLELMGIAVAILLVVTVVRGRLRGWLRHQVGIGPEVIIIATRTITAALLGLGIWIFLAFAFSAPNAGLTGVLVAALLTGIGFQDLMRSYVSGFYVLFERNVRVGERVDLGMGVAGEVTRLSMRVTYLRADDGRLVVVPNAELFNRVVMLSAPGSGSGREGAQDDAGEGGEA